MKKSTYLKLTAGFLMCLFFCGCQSGQTDEQLIKTTMSNWKQAIIAQDIDALMEFYSEDFTELEAGDKEGLRALLQEAKDVGYLEEMEINLKTAQLIITNDTAEFSIFGDEGEIEMDFTLKKEDKKTWRIIGIPSETCSYERYTSGYGDDCGLRRTDYFCTNRTIFVSSDIPADC